MVMRLHNEYLDLLADGCPKQCDFGRREVKQHLRVLRVQIVNIAEMPLGVDPPAHLLQHQPDVVERAAEIARKKLKYVYLGNV